MEFVVKDLRDIRLSIPIGILEDHKLVSRTWVTWFPLGISRHASKPSSAFVVKVQLHRFCNIRKLGLIGKKLDLETLWNLGLRNELIGSQIAKRFGLRILLPRITESGLWNEQFTGIVVTGSRRNWFALSDIPTVLISDLGHPTNLGILQRKRFFIPSTTTTVNVPTVEHAIVLKMHPAFIVDSGSKFLEAILVESRCYIV